MQTLVFVVIPSFLVHFCSSIFVDGCERGQGRGAGGSAGGASLAPINKNREHDGPRLYPYIDHTRPGITTGSDARTHIDQKRGITTTSDVRPILTLYNYGITTTSDVRTTYYHLDDLDRAIVVNL